MNEQVRNKWVYGLIWLVVLAVVIWIIAGTGSENADEVLMEQENYSAETVNESSIEKRAVSDSYYFIHAENGQINIYFYDETGEHLYSETSIPYNLLSEDDQELLNKGVRLENDEELAGFLENYDI